MSEAAGERTTRWTVVVPFFNEEGYLRATLDSLGAQSRPARLILVDNGSTDASAAIAEAFRAGRPDLDVSILDEPRPGKAFALGRGISAADGEFIATADADTWYPPEYLARAEAMMAAGGPETVAALAFGAPPPDAPQHAAVLRKGAIVSKLMKRQCHTGGYGQAFRAGDLKAVGSFDPAIWPYCLMDHEIVHRLTKRHGGRARLAYSADHWCGPSSRRANRGRVRWTLPERLFYHVCPFGMRDWFFYRFLARRFEQRGLSQLNLRRKDWLADARPQSAREEADRDKADQGDIGSSVN